MPTPLRSLPGRLVRLIVGRRRTGLLALVTCLVAALVLATPASAYWTSTGAGAGHGTTGTLAPPAAVTVPADNLSTVSVPVSWTASGGSLSPEGYYVTRSTGGAPVAACASSAAALVTGTSCTDASVPDGTYTYSVTAKYRSWTAAAVDDDTVTVMTPTKVAFTAQPTGAGAGAAISPSVAVTVHTAADAAVPLAGRSVTVALTTPAGATLSGTTTTTTNSSGVAVFAGLSIDKAANYTLTATSSGLTDGASASFTVSAGSSAAFAFATSPVNATAVASPTLGPITVRSQDALANATVAGVGGTVVNLSSSSIGSTAFAATPGGAPITSVTILAGNSTASFYYGDNKSGAPVITASGALTTATQIQTITPTAVANFAITSSPITGAASAIASLGPVRVGRQDSHGNPVLTGGTLAVTLGLNLGGTKIFAATAGGTSTPTVTIPAGQSGVDVYFGDTLTGSPVLTVSGALTSATQTQTVTSAAASKLLITSTAVSGIAAATATLGPVAVERRDQFDNLVTAGSTVVALSSSTSGTASFATSGGTPTSTVTISGGSSSVNFLYGDTKAASPTITVSSGSLTPATQIQTITAGAVSRLAITSNPLNVQAAGTPTRGPLTIARQDAFANPVSSGSTAVTLASNSVGTKSFSATSGGSATTTVIIGSGASSANFHYGDTKAGSPVVTANSGALTVAQTQTIVAGPNKKLAFVQQPTNTATGQAITPAVTARILDEWDNPSSSNNIALTIAIEDDPKILGSTTLGGTTTKATVNGSATFDDLEINVVLALGGYTLKVTSSGLTASPESNPFNITLL